MTEIDTGALAAHIAATPKRAGTTRVVAIDGPSGSGKSTLADALSDPPGVRVLRMEDMYPGWDGLDEAAEHLVREVLEPLAAGRPAMYRRWDWERERPGRWVWVEAGGTLIVEGVGSASRAAAPYLSLVVWLDADTQERRRRAILRDGETYAPHWERWAAQEHETFAREATRDRADVVIITDV